MRHRLTTLTLSILCIGLASANASTVIPLDTFPADGTPFTTSIPVYALFEWQEIAIPFHVAAAGRISQIDTALFYRTGMTPLVIGLARANLVGTSFPDSVFSETICSTNPEPDGINYCQQRTRGQSVGLAPGEFFSWTGQLFLDVGDYWLYASLEGDFVFGGWYTNSDILRQDWATRSCALSIAQGTHCQWTEATWASVAEYGPVGGSLGDGGAYATPIARIQFEPGSRVPEPSALILLSVGLVGLAAWGRRKTN